MAVYNFDVVLLGREKQGLTTLADKLLHVEDTDPIKIQILQSAGHGPGEFVDAKKCELRYNEITKIRVVDVPGFSGSQLGTLKSNTQIIQSLGSVLDEFQLHVRRIVYFIPSRGPYEKADGAAQEELKLLCHYFGEEVFDCMVVAATNPPKEAYQKLGFDYEDLELTKRAFHVALKSAVNNKNIACPPVVYIAYKDSPEQTLKKIRDAPVRNETTVPLRIKDVDPLFPDEDEIGDDFIKIDTTEDNFKENSAFPSRDQEDCQGGDDARSTLLSTIPKPVVVVLFGVMAVHPIIGLLLFLLVVLMAHLYNRNNAGSPFKIDDKEYQENSAAIASMEASHMYSEDSHLDTFNEMLPTMKESIAGSVDDLCLDAIAKKLMTHAEKAGIVEGGNKFTHTSRFLEHFALKIGVSPEVLFQYMHMLNKLRTCNGLLQQIMETLKKKARD